MKFSWKAFFDVVGVGVTRNTSGFLEIPVLISNLPMRKMSNFNRNTHFDKLTRLSSAYFPVALSYFSRCIQYYYNYYYLFRRDDDDDDGKQMFTLFAIFVVVVTKTERVTFRRKKRHAAHACCKPALQATHAGILFFSIYHLPRSWAHVE